MNKIILTFSFCAISFLVNAQTNIRTTGSLPDTIRKYFSYEKLNNISCKEVSPGIYALTFKLNRHLIPYDFAFSNDSLAVLKDMLIEALTKSLKKVKLKKRHTKYLQLFYFNNILSCNSSYDTSAISANIYRDVSNLLNSQLESIETSFKRAIPLASNYCVLETVIITDNNPNQKNTTN